VNVFYHCRAVCEIRRHERSNGRFYGTWEIELFQGNDPKWLLAEKARLLEYVHEDLGFPHVRAIRVVTPK